MRTPVELPVSTDTKGEYRVRRRMINPKYLGMLTQVRQTVKGEELDSLQVSILTKGQLNAGIVVALVPIEADRYVKDINGIWGTDHSLDDFTPVIIEGEIVYLFIVAGHRRLHACIALNDKIQRGEIAPTNVYCGEYSTELRFGLNAVEAIELQFQENIFVAPPPAEEAHAAWCFWTWRKQREPNLTQARFARDIGKSAGWVRDALRFSELPVHIQQLAHRGKLNGAEVILPYGTLVELARLYKEYQECSGEKMSDEILERWLYRYAILENLNVAQFGRYVSSYLQTKRAEQEGQIPLFTNGDMPIDARRVRRIVAPKLIPLLIGLDQYLQKLMIVSRAGGFGEEHPLEPDPGGDFSPLSPLRRVRTIIDRLIEMEADMDKLAQRVGRGRRHLKKANGALLKLREAVNDLVLFEDQNGTL